MAELTNQHKSERTNTMNKLQFQADMPGRPNIMHATGGVVFVIHAKPIRFGPYPTVEEARAAFQELVASTKAEPNWLPTPEECDEYELEQLRRERNGELSAPGHLGDGC